MVEPSLKRSARTELADQRVLTSSGAPITTGSSRPPSARWFGALENLVHELSGASEELRQARYNPTVLEVGLIMVSRGGIEPPTP